MADGILKNFEVVTSEVRNWWDDMRHIHLPRFKDGTFRLTKSNYFHLTMNLVTETIRGLPRTIAYMLVIYLLVWLVRSIVDGM